MLACMPPEATRTVVLSSRALAQVQPLVDGHLPAHVIGSFVHVQVLWVSSTLAVPNQREGPWTAL